MAIYFVFSDEAGDYKKARSNKFLQSHPYYCRSAIILNANNWKQLRDGFCSLKRNILSIEDRIEVKWSYIWSLDKCIKKRKTIRRNKPFYFLRNHSIDDLLLFVDKSIELLMSFADCHIIYTMIFNKRECTPRISEENMYKMHLQDIMQRVEMQVQSGQNNLCIFFFDTKSKTIDDNLRNAYQLISQQNNFIEQYNHIVDSMLLDFSHHNTGLQLADFCAGIFNGFLKNCEKSIELFKNRVWQKIRRHNEDILGYGLCEVPSNLENRELLRSKIDNIFEDNHEENDIPI